MICPFCDHFDNKVIDSRAARDGEVIRRRRECLSCKRRFTTYERIEANLPVIVKKDSRREVFDRGKIMGGI
ncbi:MAG: transcriptional regulator NrdR, partial [Nitrospirae bacterium]|nr:transcriptional regulator NrdR [Nitrospirota bacterium]